MAITSTRVNISLNKHLYKRYHELQDEFYKRFGERFEISSYFNEGLKQLVDTMNLYLEKYKKGELNSDVMISHFHQLMSDESAELIREAKKFDKKFKKG